jgi:hypothetical protein
MSDDKSNFYYQKNREKLIAYQKAYYETYRESILIKTKEYNKQYRLKNKPIVPPVHPIGPSYYQRNRTYCIQQAKKYYQQKKETNKIKSVKTCVALKTEAIKESLSNLLLKKEAFIAKLAEEQLTNNNIELI